MAFEQECNDADELLRMLGLNPEQCRTDGGALNLARVRTFLSERPAAPEKLRAEPAMTKMQAEDGTVFWAQHHAVLDPLPIGTKLFPAPQSR